MRLNLRLGAYTQKISNRLPIFSRKGWPPIDQIPLRFVNRKSERPARVETGISPAITPILESLSSDSGRPGYNLEYIEWQIARCPILISNCCYFPEAPSPRATIVYWRSILKNSWRFSIWALNTARDQVPALLSNVIREIYKSRGTLISVVVSRTDAALIEILTEAGFSSGPEGMPLYALTSRRAEAMPELSHLSYLDCDLSYRF
jgi:hypothetical protein